MKISIPVLLLLTTAVQAAPPSSHGPAAQYAEHCASCHTASPAVHFQASTLLKTGSAEQVASAIREGVPGRGMPGFGPLLGDEGVLRLAAFLRAQVVEPNAARARSTGTMVGRTIEAEDLHVDRSAGYWIGQEGTMRFLQYVDRGSHLCYENVDLTGVRSIEYRYAKGDGEPPRRFALLAFSGDFTGAERIPLGEKITQLTGGWNRFVDARIGLARELTGSYRLCFIGMGGGGVFNLDSFTLSGQPGTHDGITQTFAADDRVFHAAGHSFRLEKVGEIDGEFWSLDSLDAHTMVATQKSGLLWLFRGGERLGPITGVPDVHFKGQGGLLEVRAHPHYRRNGWVYLTYSQPAGAASMLTIVRGRIQGTRWVDPQTIYQAAPEFFTESEAHYGARLAFDGVHLYFGIGDRGHPDNAQDLRNPFGKIHRLHTDGRVPRDNPFVELAGALPTIFSLGHRNPQGLTVHLRSRELWATEHGPKGGDELNKIERGRNYGWPLVTFGINYDGTIISPDTARAGLEPPRVQWTPSPGVSNLMVYTGREFPGWRGHLLVTSLAHQKLILVKLAKGVVSGEEILLEGAGRIRDIAVGAEGYPYLAVNQPNGQVLRLIPEARGKK